MPPGARSELFAVLARRVGSCHHAFMLIPPVSCQGRVPTGFPRGAFAALLLATAALLAACGDAPSPDQDLPSSTASAPAAPAAASSFVPIEPGPGADTEIVLRMKAANLAADSALRNNRPFLALLELEKLEQSGLPDTYRAMVWVNIGVVRGRIGALAAARDAFDRAIQLEHPLGRHFAMTLKAVFLAEHGFPDESIAIFEELLKRNDLRPEERTTFEENIRVLKVSPRSVVIR